MMDEEELLSERGRISQQDGEVGQIIAHQTLKNLGLERVQTIHTPWKIVWGTASRGRRVPLKAFPLKKVDGDFIAVVPGTGQSVLVEVKYRQTRDTLRWSDLQPHQRDALTDHGEAGGLSLLAWVLDNNECIVMRWPIEGFGPRQSITLDVAIDNQWEGI